MLAMKILAIDTSTEACSACLSIDGNHLLRYKVAPREHAELILPMVDDLLKQADVSLHQLDCLAFGRGPGAFTGIRIATGVIQGLAYAVDLPVVPISSLATLAQSVANEQSNIIPAFDARMGEIYYGLYQTQDNGLVQLIGEEAVLKPDIFPVPSQGEWFGIGTGWDTYLNILSNNMSEHLISSQTNAYPSAEHIIPLAIHELQQGNTVSAEQAIPVYLRNKVTF